MLGKEYCDDTSLTELAQRCLVRPNEETGTTPLDTDESQRFRNFIQLVSEACKSKKVITVHRGERIGRLKEKLLSDSNSINGSSSTPGRLWLRLFFFGDKAKHYFRESSKDVDGRDHLKRIDDNSDATFEYIFRQISKLVDIRKLPEAGPSKAEQDQIRRFLEKNERLVNYFSQECNLPSFLEVAATLSNSDRTRVKDYYLFTLHKVGKLVIGQETYFVSTSRKFDAASRFAGVNGKQHRQGIMLYGFVPEPFDKYAIASDIIEATAIICEQHDLPLIAGELYPDQYEVGLKGALFPHFIIGACRFRTGDFVVNPHLLEPNQRYDAVLRNGIFLDQTDFQQEIKDSGYNGYVSRTWHGQYVDVFHK